MSRNSSLHISLNMSIYGQAMATLICNEKALLKIVSRKHGARLSPVNEKKRHMKKKRKHIVAKMRRREQILTYGGSLVISILEEKKENENGSNDEK